MNQATLHSLPAEVLHNRVREAIRRHWVDALRPEPAEPIEGTRLEERSRAVLDTMLTRQFRVGPLPPQKVYDQLLERVRRRVRHGQPVHVTVGYGPLKNPNAVSYSVADWAEFFALCHLVAWHNKVRAVYPPGLALDIAFDDTTLVLANRADKGRINSYTASVAALIHTLGFEGVLRASLRHSQFAWLFHFGLYQLARLRVALWEHDPRNRPQTERMNQFARRNVALPTGLDPAEQEAYVRAASHRYRVYWEALQLSGVTHSKSRIIAMYLDGSQHHIRQMVALHLTSLDKGQVTQPWQGIGALLDNGHGGLEPIVLTAGRQRRYTTVEVDGLDLLLDPRFARIAIAEPSGGSGFQS
jgi:hypothetical protein